MRERFDLDLVSLDKLALLIHGAYGAGKTHLQGDFLSWASVKGPVAFLNIKGEDGQMSLAHARLGTVGQTVTTLAEYNEVLKEYAGQHLAALAVDALPALYDLILMSLNAKGELRYPDASIDGDRSRMMWGQATMRIRSAVIRSREVAPYVLWTSAYDRSANAVETGAAQRITPNLPGKLADGIAGVFDAVGYLTAETLSPEHVQRRVLLAPTLAVLTKLRLPRPITKPIDIPAGKGGWAAIFAAFEAALKPV